MMDYYQQPPAIVRQASQANILSCENIVKKSKEGVVRYTIKAKTSEDMLKFFKGRRNVKLERRVDETVHDLFTRVFGRQVSHGFYRAASPDMDWDVVLNYFTDVKRPFGAHVAAGKIDASGALLYPDSAIRFNGTTEMAEGTHYNFEGLVTLIPDVITYTCDNGMRHYLDSLLKRGKKQK